MQKNSRDIERVVFKEEFKISIKVIDGIERYFIKYFSVRSDNEVEIDLDTYNLYKFTFSKPLKKLKNEFARRRDFKELDEVLKEQKYMDIVVDIEELCCINLDLEFVKEVLNICTPVQRKRFVLYYIYGYTYKEIAEFENCTITAITTSLSAVLKKLNKK